MKRSLELSMFTICLLQTWSPSCWTQWLTPGWTRRPATTRSLFQSRTPDPDCRSLSLFPTQTLSSVHLRSSRYRNLSLWLLCLIVWLRFLVAVRDSFLFYHTDSARQICSAAAVWDQKASQTDAQHQSLVNVLHQWDHCMWWVTMTIIC